MNEKLLHYIGFSENETKLYMALLQIGEGTVDEIVRLANVRRPTAYKVLRELVHKGFIAEIIGKPTLFRMLPPEHTLENAYKRKILEIEYLSQELPKSYNEFIEDARKIYDNSKSNIDLGHDIMMIRGLKTVTELVTRLQNQVKNCVRISTKSPFSSPEELDEIKKEFDREEYPDVSSSVELKVICEMDVLENPTFIEVVKNLELHKQYYRCLPSIPMELTIFDDFGAILELNRVSKSNLENYETLYIQNRQIIKLLTFSFDFLWEKAKIINNF